MAFYVYILQSETTGRYYVGQTKDLQERIAYHRANYSKSLKNRRPWVLATVTLPPIHGKYPPLSSRGRHSDRGICFEPYANLGQPDSPITLFANKLP